tara:strand:- start:388 stop:957 length:570 start_codon:yes stop_codon:yes gene_type:complete
MFAFKNKYYLIIDSTKDINLNNFIRNNKFVIIYRNSKKPENFETILNFRKKCRSYGVLFFVANNMELCSAIRSDGLYISASNKSLKYLNLKKLNVKLIGSAHNIRELNTKIKQGCTHIIFSKLFKVDYDPNARILGVIKFNNLINIFTNIIPLGGIKINNLNKLRMIRSTEIAVMSEVKKKPAISNRLF